MAQLVELPILEIRGSNPITGVFYLLQTELKSLWLWLSWESDYLWHQRSAVRIQLLAYFINCKLNLKVCYCGWDGRVIAYDTRDPWFESNHRSILFTAYRIKKKRPAIKPFQICQNVYSYQRSLTFARLRYRFHKLLREMWEVFVLAYFCNRSYFPAKYWKWNGTFSSHLNALFSLMRY